MFKRGPGITIAPKNGMDHDAEGSQEDSQEDQEMRDVENMFQDEDDYAAGKNGPKLVRQEPKVS